MTQPAPWKIAVICLFVMAIVGVAVMVIVSVMDTGPTDMNGDKPPQPSTAPAYVRLAVPAPATTQSTNAADSYGEAFKLFQQLKAAPAEIALFDQYDSSNRFDDQAAAFFDRNAMIVSWVRHAATLRSCDWGHPTVAERLPVLNQTRAVARFMILHARYAAETNDKLTAADDLVATLAFARHVGSGGVLVNKLVEAGIEQLATDPLIAILPSLPKERLAWLSKQLDDLPPSATGKQLMQSERDAALQTARDQNQLVQIDAINSLDEFYRAIGEAMDQSPDVLDKVADEQLAKLQEGSVPQMLAKVFLPSLKRARSSIAKVEAKRAELRSDIDTLKR